MYRRTLNVSLNNSFFLFGPRGTGKSTFLSNIFKNKSVMWIDLLDPSLELEYSIRPNLIIERYSSLEPKPEWVVIDEVQKVPAVLNIVHLGIEKYNIKFALTGSSARKLKKGAANLLAGRAFVFNLYTLTYAELSSDFNLESVLSWGTLPKIYQFNDIKDKSRFLKSYTLTYLKEEIQSEQIVRKIEPFRRFLDVAGQSNCEILNFSKLAREANLDSKTVERYFEILVDTLLGFYLEAYSKSVRKRQLLKSKFYFFDTGVARAIQNNVDTYLSKNTYAYGKLFEHFIILELIKLNSYHEKNYSFSYLKTKDGAEIDLILSKNQKVFFLIEIKSSQTINDIEINKLRVFQKDFKDAELLMLSNEKQKRVVKEVKIFPWQEGLEFIINY